MEHEKISLTFNAGVGLLDIGCAHIGESIKFNVKFFYGFFTIVLTITLKGYLSFAGIIHIHTFFIW